MPVENPAPTSARPAARPPAAGGPGPAEVVGARETVDMAPRRYANGQFTAVILGGFGSAWFGWAHDGAPASWSVPLTVASLVSIGVAVLGGLRMWPARRDLSARDRSVSRPYGIVVGLSYAVILVGNVLLGRTGHGEYIAPWVGFAIGAHFWALLPVLKDRILIPLGVVVVLIAGIAVVVYWANDLLPSVITGVGTGSALLVVAVIELLRRRPR